MFQSIFFLSYALTFFGFFLKEIAKEELKELENIIKIIKISLIFGYFGILYYIFFYSIYEYILLSIFLIIFLILIYFKEDFRIFEIIFFALSFALIFNKFGKELIFITVIMIFEMVLSNSYRDLIIKKEILLFLLLEVIFFLF